MVDQIRASNEFTFPFLKTIYTLTLIGTFIFLIYSWNFEKADKIFDFLKVTLWPIAFLIFVFLFRNNIAKFIENLIIRVKGPGDTEITLEQQKKVQEQKSGIIQISQEELGKLSKQTEEIKKEYEDQLNKERKEKEGKEAFNNYLIDQLFIKDLQIDFERIYRLIFGSQIMLLRNLSSKGSSGSTTNELLIFFVMVQRIWSPAFQNWTFNLYLEFLLKNQLIQLIPPDSYLITEKGKAFLIYITSLSYPENKSL